MPNKEYIPHTNPNWNLELPDGDLNSLVSKDGRNHDDGFNFDEKDDDDTPEFDPEAAKKAREETQETTAEK